MKKVFLIALVFFALYSNAQTKNKRFISEDRILDTIFSLPEVKEQAKRVKNLSHGKRHLSNVIYQRPGKDFSYYWVKVWEDNDNAYVTHFNFYVNPKTSEIKFYDVVNDKLLDLTTWRKSRNKNQ